MTTIATDFPVLGSSLAGSGTLAAEATCDDEGVKTDVLPLAAVKDEFPARALLDVRVTGPAAAGDL